MPSFQTEIVHSFHSKAFHNLECSVVDKPALLSELSNESTAHLSLVLLPQTYTLHLPHSFFKIEIKPVLHYKRGSELDTKDSEVKAQALVLKELTGQYKKIKKAMLQIL